MSHYIAGGLMLLLLVGVTVLGMEAYSIYGAAQMVDAALLDGQQALTIDGGLSSRVEALVRERIIAEGGDPDRLFVSGTRAHAPYGELVTLRVVYDHPYTLHFRWWTGAAPHRAVFRISRVARTLSGYQP